MSGNVIIAFALIAALIASSAASSPASFAAGKAREPNILQKPLVQTGRVRDSSSRQEPAPQTLSARMERRAHLSEDEREIMTKQIMQAISEMMNSECMLSRDYQGWVDFGRRDAE